MAENDATENNSNDTPNIETMPDSSIVVPPSDMQVPPAVEAPAPIVNAPQAPFATLPNGVNTPKKKWLVPAFAIAAVVVLGGALFGFKQYTSSSSYVWDRAFANTAKGYDQVVSQAKTLTEGDINALEATGKMNFETPTTTLSGTLKSTFGEENGEGTFDFKVTNSLDGNEISLSAGLDVKLIDEDLYFQARDLDKIGKFLEQMGASPAEITEVIKPYNNQWYVITSDELEKAIAEDAATTTGTSLDDMDSKEVAAKLTKFMSSLGDATKKYALTADENLAIIEQREFIGKETKNDRTMYHYKAAVNKENAKKFVKELQNIAVDSELLEGSDKITDAEIADGINSISSSYEFDVWVDGNTKLIGSLRFPIPEAKDTYIELGLPHDVSENLEFYVAVHSGEAKSDAKVSASLNANTKALGFSMNVNSGSLGVKGSVTVTAKPLKQEPKVSKPSDAKNFTELKSNIDQTELYINNSRTLGGESVSPFGSTMTPADEYDFSDYESDSSDLNLLQQ